MILRFTATIFAPIQFLILIDTIFACDAGYAHLESRFYLIQKLAQHIDSNDLFTETTFKAGTRKRTKVFISEDFFAQLDALKGLGVETHEQTKNSVSHTGTKVAYYLIPLVFLAVIYDRRNAFQVLMNFFGPNIDDLKDGMSSEQGNILHHMYGHNSKASPEMITDVFNYLEQHMSNERILEMIYDENTLGNGRTVLDCATSYGLDADLRTRIAKYSGMPSVLPVDRAFVSSRDGQVTQSGVSFFSSTYEEDREAALTLLALKVGAV